MTVAAVQGASNDGEPLDFQKLWGQALAAFDVSLVVLNGEGRLAGLNETAEQISGYDREEVLGEPAEILVAPEERAKVKDVLGRLYSESAANQTDTRWITKGGEQRLVRCTTMSLPGESGEPSRVIGLGVDLTRRRELDREVVDVEEELRQEFGAELHDMLASHLAGTSMLAAALANKVERGGVAKAEEIRRLAELVQEAMEHVRKLSHGFVAAELEAEDLAAALEQLAEQTEAVSQASCTCRVAKEASVSLPSEEAALHLCRIAQEAVRNALKHARPSRIEIVLETREDPSKGVAVALEVRDNGAGLPEEVGKGAGMKSMHRRARLMGAELEVEPSEEGGTCVRCVLPLGSRQ